MILKLEQAAMAGDELKAKRLLKELVPGYGINGLRPVEIADLKTKSVRIPTGSIANKARGIDPKGNPGLQPSGS